MIRLMYITNDPVIGQIAQNAGVDWIFVDLEYRVKKQRQENRNTVISAHTIDDIVTMRKAITTSKLLVRINPLGEWTEEEIESTIQAGADIIMLPVFNTKIDVENFVYLVAGRAQVCLLVETILAVSNIVEIIEVPGVDFIHIGFNDLHIARKTTFMFEFLSDGSMDSLAKKIYQKGIPFGFGGMARIGELVPPAEHILTEHYRLGSTGVILARSFCNFDNFNSSEDFEQYFKSGVEKIRNYELKIKNETADFYEANRLITKAEVEQVVNSIKQRK